MFLTSLTKPIEPSLKDIVDEIEEQSPGLSVIAARQFRYSLNQTLATVKINQSRRLTVLEEFILRAGLELIPTPTETELAKVLGLDPVFIENTTNKLKYLETLEKTQDLTIKLTNTGKQFYERGSVAQEPKTEEIYAIFNPLLETTIFKSSPYKNNGSDNFPNLGEFMTVEPKVKDLALLSLEEVQNLIRQSGLRLHIPEDDRIVTSCLFDSQTETIFDTISVFFMFDVVDDKFTFLVKQNKRVLENFSNYFNKLYLEEKIFLEKLFQLSKEDLIQQREEIIEQNNQEVENRLNKIREQAIQATKNLRDNPQTKNKKDSGNNQEIVLVRDRFIRKVFLDTLKSAQHYVLIYSPWISEAVIDREFLKILRNLVQKGVSILIGHGIARKKNLEDRPIPPDLEAKLKNIETPEGLPGVQVVWLGNSHAKEVIVDSKIHLCGSHNWLSYRGDRLPRGETVYKITVPDQVQEAYNYYVKKFGDYAQQKWNKAIQEKDLYLAVEILGIWDALGIKETQIIEQIKKAEWLELILIWLKLLRQKLRLKTISVDSDCFEIAILSAKYFSGAEEYIQLLIGEYQLLIEAISEKNKQRALNLLNPEVWSHFRRLGITSVEFSETPHA